MRYFTYQGNDFDCGFASLKMLLCYAHQTTKYLSLAKPVEKNGRYSYRDLIEIASRHSVTLTAYKLIDNVEIKKQKSWPLLVSLVNQNNSLHLVVLRKIKGNKVFIDDPASGAATYRYEDFIKRWDGSFIQISKVSKAGTLQKEKPIIQFSKQLLLFTLQTFSALFALLGFAFVSSQTYFAYPLLFFALFVVCELLFRRFQLGVLSQFDDCYMHRTYDDDKTVMKKKFVKFHEFKKNYFMFPQMIIGSVIITFFAIFILTFNDLRNLLFLLVLIVFAFCDFLLCKYVDDRHQKVLEKIEDESFLKGLNKSDVLNNYQKMSSLALFIAKSAITRKYLGLFLVGVSALTYAAISAEAMINYFLFHYFVYLLFYENVSKLLNSLFSINKIKRETATFKDQFVK